MADKTFWTLSVEAAALSLKTDAANGLSAAEAEKRLTEFGRNKLAGQPRQGLPAKFIAHFKSFMILILLTAPQRL